MRYRILAVLVLATAFATTAAHAQRQFQVFASVFETATGMPARSLEPTDVRIQENGADAKVLKVEPVNWPVKIQLLLDTGVGLGGSNLQILKDGVTGFLNALPTDVEVTIVTTAPQPRFLVRPTPDRKLQLDGLTRLSPDSGAGRFVESLNEATQRTERDKTDHFSIIVSAATTSGDANVMERDVKRIFERIQKMPTTVHVILLSSTAGSATGGANQTQVGIAVSEYTGGRYENIAAATRLATLLPEVGEQVADAVTAQSNQFRLTLERPASAQGDMGAVSAGARPGLELKGLSMDGRLR